MPKLSFREVIDALEILAQDNPEGVIASQVWSSFFGEQCELSLVQATLSQLIKNGYAVRHLGDSSAPGRTKFLYLPSGKQYTPPLVAQVASSPVPLPVAPAPLSIPSLKNVDLKELRGILSKAIDAVEVLQDQIQPLLAGLLDLDRDCETLEKVKDILTGMKTLMA